MRALDRKLFRDMKRLWAQSLAVSLVMAAGVATILIGLGAYNSLSETRSTYYDRSQFADIFAFVIRAPKSIAFRIRELDGVAQVETRIVKSALVDIQSFDLPATANVISIPVSGESLLNRLVLRSGKLPLSGSTNEVAVNESFAKAHKFEIGSKFDIVLNGKKRQLTITATALSPEFIYAIGPGDMMPDNRRFGIVWMREPALAAAFNMEGAFNNVTLRLLRKANSQDILQKLDLILERYGSEGAYTRDDQISHAFLNAELKQLSAISRILPPVFLVVTAFLVNMVLSRLISLEREQIGLLKAIGYTPSEIAIHYVKLVLLIACMGVAIGFVAGTWLSRGLTLLYATFFNFPYQIFVLSPPLYAAAALVAVAAALFGGMRAVLSAAALSPSVAMQPPVPPSYKRIWSGPFQPLKHFSQLTTMVLRNVTRWPVRALLTTLGISLSVALLVGSLFSEGAINYMIDANFNKADRQDASIAFGETRPANALQEVKRLPGVLAAEPYHLALARISNGHHQKRVAILGKPASTDISRVLDITLQPVELPNSGIVVSEALAKTLHIERGASVHIEFLGRNRRQTDVPVIDIIQSYVGLNAYMRIDALNRILGEQPSVSGINLLLDPAQSDVFFKKIKNQPTLSALALQRISLAKFRETIAKNISIQIAMYSGLATIIAFGVVYNTARIQLAERARELASLRVLGFTDYEVSRVLLLEFVLLTCAAIPIGWTLGYGLAYSLITAFQSDLYRLPFIIERSTYAYSALIVIAAVTISALIVRRRVSNLDLVSVLKTRD
jgi:putative ABC transport system permease protein